MGKNLTQQKRGKGSSTFTRPSFKFKGQSTIGNDGSAVIAELITCRAHSAPIAILTHHDNTQTMVVAPEGICVGQEIKIGGGITGSELSTGNYAALKDIPEGTVICNIEARPGDGGKFVRASGMSARIVAKMKGTVSVLLPSKKIKQFNPDCRACIGIIAGSGRPEKPFYKAGRKFHAMKAKNRYWPSVSGNSMNAVDHPFGGKSSHRKGRPTTAPKNAPPGRMVGAIRPRHTGRNK